MCNVCIAADVTCTVGTAANWEQLAAEFWLQVMYGHHVATLGLVSLSYFNGWQPIGAAEPFASSTRKQQGFDSSFYIGCRL